MSSASTTEAVLRHSPRLREAQARERGLKANLQILSRHLTPPLPATLSFPPNLMWCGLDFGETIMNPFTLHQSSVIREIYRELGREQESEERVHRWYRLRDSFGSPGEPAHLQVRLVKQYARAKIYRDVLDNDPEAVKLFDQKEIEGFSPAHGLKGALSRLTESGVEVNVVSEVTQLPAVLSIVRYLQVQGLRSFFSSLYTPAGLFDIDGKMLDGSFEGATKKSGAMYEKLRTHLESRGVSVSKAIMIGDDPVLDVENAKLQDFLAALYVGIIDRGGWEKADYVIKDWDEIPAIA